MEGKRKVIGFMLEELESKFATELVHDVVNSIPKDENIELVVTAGKYINQAVHEKTRPYKLVYNSIYKLSNVCHLDGLLIHLGSIEGAELERLKKEYYAGIDDIPKVFITFTSSEQTTVNYDNESGIREAVNCLVNVNGLTRFCMLGGRDDNADARERRDIFIKCLKENGIELSRWNYEKTDMYELTVTEAERLLDNNPGVQAIFCVNDAVAKGLYTAMRKRSLVPGEDIMVFGFDNTHMAGEMIPTLSSIGTDNCSLGQRALGGTARENERYRDKVCTRSYSSLWQGVSLLRDVRLYHDRDAARTKSLYLPRFRRLLLPLQERDDRQGSCRPETTVP